MIRKLTPVIVLLTITECAWRLNDTHVYQLYVDPDGFTNEEIADVYGAALEWEWATGSTIRFDVTGVDQGPHLVHVQSVKKGEIGTHAGECLSTAFTSTENIKLTPVSLGTAPSSFAMMAKHELGHSLGLEHDVKGTVMCASTGCSSHVITCRDVYQFCYVWGCAAAALPGCIE